MGFEMAGIADEIEWRVSDGLVDYLGAVAEMEARVAQIRAGRASEFVWLLEHPPIYTAGTSAQPDELLDAKRLPVHRTGRGGRYTYHGPGQRIGYVLLDLTRRGGDVHCHVHHLEEWVIRALARFGVHGERREGRIGVWVGNGKSEAKIAAVGVRVRRWVTYHGMALNIDPDLDHYRGIVPCGISEYGVTSLARLGIGVTPVQVDSALRESLDEAFGEAPECRLGADPK